MKTAAAFVVGVILGVGAWAVLSSNGPGGGGGTPPPSAPATTLPPALCEGRVKLSLRGTTIVADPDIVCLAVGRPLTWEFVDKGTVTIEFVPQGTDIGPFPQEAGNTINPAPGKYEATNDNTTSGPLSIKTLGARDLPGQWKYAVAWKPLTGPAPQPLDPVVCIRR